MPQDQAPGAAAAQWGRETARRIAKAIGATIPGGTSNECVYKGDAVVIKCAAVTNDSVGVTFNMLERVKAVIGAFAMDEHTFELWTLSPSVFADQMRDTSSKGASAGKVGIVRRAVFEDKGTSLGTVRL